MNDALQCLIFDESGNLITEIEPEIESVSWRLNWMGQAKFFLPYTDFKCTLHNLRYGRRVLVRYADEIGLPDFGGVIDTPRKRTPDGVYVTAYSGEKLLDWRVTAKAREFRQATPGSIFQDLITEANGVYATGITTGEIDLDGTPRSPTFHYHELLRRVKDLTTLSGQDFAVLPSYSGGGLLLFLAYWYSARRGRDVSSTARLIEGLNLVDVILDEQGQIANRVILVGEGSSWGDERHSAIAEDTSSRNMYGYREWADVHVGVTNSATLDASAEELLEDMKHPRKMLSLTVANDAPAGFGDYGIGDIVSVEAFLDGGEWSYSGTVRVVARAWRPDGLCRLEVQVWE